MIGTEEIASLAALYDRYANAFERTSPDRAQRAGSFMPGWKCCMSGKAGA